MSYAIKLNSTDQILTFRAYTQDSTSGQYIIPETGLNSSTDGLSLAVKRIGETAVSIASLTDKAADNTTHADGAIRWLGGNHYSVDVPDSSFATQVPSVMIGGIYTSGLIEGDMHPVVGYDATLNAVGAADAVWDEDYASHTTSGTFGKLMDILRKSNLTTDGVVDGVPDSGSFDSNITQPDRTFDHQFLIFTDGSLVAEGRPITSQIGGQFIFEEPFASIPASGDSFSILPYHTHPVSEIQNGLATYSQLLSRTLPSGDYFSPTEDGVFLAANAFDLVNIGYSNYYATVERSTADTNNIIFQWIESGVTPSGQVSINGGAYSNTAGTVSYLRTEGSKHYFTLAYNVADRPSAEGTARYKIMNDSVTRYFNLKVGGENTYDPEAALGVINQGVQKASKLIPHGENI